MRAFTATLISAPGIVLMLAAFGCSGGERYADEKSANQVEAPLAAATHFQVIDVPVPAIFKYDRKRSSIYKKEAGRQASLVYKGRAHIERVANFYRDHMAAPTPGWKLTDDQMRGVRYVLIFTKGKERCMVTILPGAMGTVQVTVDIN